MYIYDKNLKTLLNKRYKIPKGKKSSKISLPRKLPLEEKFKFLRGLFSGDGSVSFDKKKNKRYMQITFWTKSKKLIHDLVNILNKNNISCGLNYSSSKEQYRLTIRKYDSLLKFKELIGFCHPKKHELLKNLT